MKFIVKLIILLLMLFAFKGNSQGCLVLDIVLVADYSASMQGQEERMNHALQSFVNRFRLSDNGIKIGLVLFNSQETVMLEVTSDSNNLMNYLIGDWRRKAEGSTNMAESLSLAESMLILADRKASQMIILISDGDPDSEDATTFISTRIKKNNIQICTILAGDKVKPDYLMSISSNCFTGTSYLELVETLESLDICL